MSDKNGVLQDAARELKELRKTLAEGTEETRTRVQSHLKTTASAVRAELDELDDDAREQAERLLHDLDQFADTVEKQAARQFKEVDQQAHKNPWRLILTAFVIGLIIGILIKKD